MKLLYKDSNKLSETEIFFEDNIYSKVRIIFEDDNEYYVYYSNDITNQVYINRIKDFYIISIDDSTSVIK